jgi:polysaccharide export outer membrane protein
MRRGLDTITVSVTPHVNAVTSTVIGSGGALQRRRTELQAEVARWGTANAANAASAAPAAPARASMGGGDPNMVSAGTIPGINPGDTVEVSVLEDPSTGGTFLVNTSGAIDLPGIGTVQILGQSEAGAADLIRQKLEGAVLVTATVAVRHIPQLRETRIGLSSPPAAEVYSIIYLAGEFITPGPLRIPADVSPTLLQTIIRSGGITPSGDLTRVKLLRIGGEVSAMEEINVAGILSGQMPPNDVALAPNDIIVIPLFAPVVYVTGNVERAGTLRLFQDETLTAYAAILRAGGFSRFANLRKCYVVRDLGNGEKMQIPVNVREVQKGKFPDVILQGKDIVVVPERFFSF